MVSEEFKEFKEFRSSTGGLARGRTGLQPKMITLRVPVRPFVVCGHWPDNEL
jgi:hypothetical protein